MATTLASTFDHSLLNDVFKVIQNLRKKYKRIQTAEETRSSDIPISKEQEELISSKHFTVTDLQWFEKEFELLRKLSKCLQERSSSSMNEGQVEESRDNERYLCVTYDSVMFCLDLKCMGYSKNKLLPLPKISAHKFSKKGNPVSMGLFKMGSGAYMVGGHRYKSYRMTRGSLRAKDEETMCTYKVTLVDDMLSLSKCKSITDLKKPKLWPTVQKIDNEIHVIESVPEWEWSLPTPSSIPSYSIPSHEVLRLDKNNAGIWTELSPKSVLSPSLKLTLFNAVSEVVDALANDYHMHTWSRILIGKRIYTCGPVRHHSWFPEVIGIYDVENNQWEINEIYGHPHLYKIRHVAQLLRFGCGICVGKFLGRADHMVIAIGRAKRVNMEAVAYLVAPTGQVLCYQRLPSFFGDVLQYAAFVRGTMFRVEEEGGTVCAVVEGWLCTLRGSREEPGERFLRVSTFTVEEGCGARTLALDLGVKARRRKGEVCISDLPDAVEKDFVNIVVKDSYAFKLEEDDVVGKDERISACFL